MIVNKYLAFALLLLAAAPLFAGPDDYVEWKPIPGSSGYQLQVRDAKTKRIMVDQFVEGTYLDVDLQVGHFEQRLAPLSPFGKPLIWSDWRPLNILVALSPVVDEANAVEVKERRPFSMFLRGKNFTPNTRVFLKKDGNSIPVPNRSINAAGTELTLLVNPATIPPGNYSLYLENPRQKTWTGESLVSLKYAENAVAVVDPKDQKDVKNPLDQKDPRTQKNQRDQKDPKNQNKTQQNKSEITGDFRDHLRTMPSTCKNSGLPDELVLKCYKRYIVLNLSTPAKVELFNYLMVYQGNYDDRMRGYSAFRDSCNSMSRHTESLLRERLAQSGESLDLAEKQQIQGTLSFIHNCNASSNP
jgi:hypothetical protein